MIVTIKDLFQDNNLAKGRCAQCCNCINGYSNDYDQRNEYTYKPNMFEEKSPGGSFNVVLTSNTNSHQNHTGGGNFKNFDGNIEGSYIGKLLKRIPET